MLSVAHLLDALDHLDHFEKKVVQAGNQGMTGPSPTWTTWTTKKQGMHEDLTGAERPLTTESLPSPQDAQPKTGRPWVCPQEDRRWSVVPGTPTSECVACGRHCFMLTVDATGAEGGES